MKTIERKPKYAMRKLSIGLVSCMLGFTLVAQPSHSFASGGAESDYTEVAQALADETNEPQKEDKTTELREEGMQGDSQGEELDIAEAKEFESVANPAVDEEQYMFDIRWEYKHLKPGQYPNYDPALKGKEFKAQFCLEIQGTYVDEKGNEKTETIYSKFQWQTLKVGETSTIDIRNLKYDDSVNLTKYKSIGYKSLIWPVHPDTNNYRWSLGDSSYDAIDEHPNRYYTELSQNMNTRVEYKQEDKSIILDDDQNNIDLKYNIKKRGSEDLFVNNKRNAVVTESDKFTTNERKEAEKWLSLKRLGNDKDSINTAITGSRLELFNTNVNRKGREYELVVGFKGKDDKDTERLNKYYTLKIEGNDLNGWNVTLGSNLKEKSDIKDTTTKFTTKEIYDDTLDEGVREIKQIGKDGIVRDTYKVIYLPGKNGTADEEVERKLIKNEKIQQLVEQIIRVGTRKKNNPSGPIVTPGDDESPIVPMDPKENVPTKEDEDEYNKLIKELLEEIEKEADKENEKSAPEKEDSEKGTESENKAETTNPKKEEKAKEETVAPIKRKPAGEKASKEASPKTGVTGSAAIAALGISSLFASLGLRKKND